MSEQVDNPDRQWPPNQWHPIYRGFTEWLDNEAPVPEAQKLRNRRTLRPVGKNP